MSSNGGIGSTLIGGIQNIAAILPLLGTEHCSNHVSSALTRGYLKASATPMSIFGSLGVVTAGFKTLVACFSFGGIEGAKLLGNMGFEPQGENLSLIMVESGKGKNNGRYIVETRIDELIKELNIDKDRITGVSHKSAAWNIKMMATTALLCAFSITPYVYLNRGPNHLDKSTIWIFPVLRATGGFITATLIQLLIQRRITTLSDQYLVKRDQQRLRNTDIEAAGDLTKYQMVVRRITPTWLLLCLLLIGLLASVVGYVGCFSVVQNSTSTIGPISWLCLEAGLSVMRLAIWAWNPTRDDAPPLEIILELDKYEHKPLPTCNKDNEEILEYRVLPLTRARDFLKIITSFAGLIQPFSNPDLSLYYTLTQKNLGERTLYITVFDHKERTTRVYIRFNERDFFYSTKSDAPLVDIGHYLLEVEIDAIIDPKGDPVSSNSNNLDSLRKHHRSILEHIQYRLGAGDGTQLYAIENGWTMKVEDTISTVQRLRDENEDDWNRVVAKGKGEEQNEKSSLISDYFMHLSIEKDRRRLDEKRVKWVTRRMEMITKETKERFQGEMVEYRVNKQEVEKNPATKSPEDIELMLLKERYLMELLVLYEVARWEQLFWNKFKGFLDQIGNGRAEEKERLTREWKANYWKRLSPQMHAAQKRLADLPGMRRYRHPENLCRWWTSSISRIFEGVGVRIGVEAISLLSNLRTEIRHQRNDEIRLRMENEIEDTEFRLKFGSDLGRFDQFWDDSLLFKCRYSRSKWLFFQRDRSTPLESYLHALKGNKNIIHITFVAVSDSDVKEILAVLPSVTSISRNKFDLSAPRDSLSSFISDSDDNAILADLPWVTSISRGSTLPPAIHRDPLFIKSTDNDLITFAKETRLKLDPFSTYIFTDAGDYAGEFYMSDSEKLWNNARVLISFVAPTSGQSLILRLKHSGKEDGPLEITLGSTIIQLNPSSESSLTIDDITLYPIPGPSESVHLSFEPGIRNDIVIQFGGSLETSRPSRTSRHGHFLHDIELLDKAGLEYMPHSPSLSILSN